MIRVLFVCSGNICRSPMAEAVFVDRVAKAGLADQISADSAGTGAWHIGERAHPGTLSVLRSQNIAYQGCARQLQRADLTTFDYVLAMDGSHLSFLRRLAASGESTAVIEMFLRYANDAGLTTVHDVPDPYYDDSFDTVYHLVDLGVDALLAHLRREHGL